MQWEPRVVVHRVEEKRCGLAEGDLERARIDGVEAGFREVGEFTFVVILGADDVPEHVGILGTEGGRDHALVALDEIVGGDGVAVGPLGVGAEVEGVAESVG